MIERKNTEKGRKLGEMERSCELCSKAARMYCESDEARLCWECDEKVHSANFLVAKHSRSLLCHVCQSPTPWKASGTKLGHTVSVCDGCFDAQNPTTSGMRMRMRRPHPHEEAEELEDQTDRSFGMEDGDRESESSSARSTDEEHDSDEDEEEDGENQVVPWASCPSQSVPSAPPLTTSSSSEHGSFSTRNDALKRSRDSHIHDSDDEDAACSSQGNSNTAAEGSGEVAALRAAKIARVEDHPELRRRRMELVDSLMSFRDRTAAGGREHNHNASEVIRRISNLSRDAF